MSNNMRKRIAAMTKQHRNHRWWKRTVSVLAAITVFITTYALILPAITQERETFCGLEEHTHSKEAGCYTETPVLLCNIAEGEGHTHTDECYEISSELVCQKEEHQHTDECYIDKNADVESREVWERTFSHVRLTGVWADDVQAIAETQLGYRESEKNYALAESGEHKGYTRYGDWYGDPYGDWSAMFVSFCLNYAVVDSSLIPFEGNCAAWVEMMDGTGSYQQAGGSYIPRRGDLIFFDNNRDDIPDHVGLVCNLCTEDGTPLFSAQDEETELVPTTVKTIEGDSLDRVQYAFYALNDAAVMGYGILPANPSLPEESDLPEESGLTDDPAELADEITEHEDITCSDPDFLRISRVEEESWALKAQKPLTDEKPMTVTMDNGDSFTILAANAATTTSYTISWSGTNNYGKIVVHYIDMQGNPIQGPDKSGSLSTDSGYVYSKALVGEEIEGYTYVETRYGDPKGDKIWGFQHSPSTSYYGLNHPIFFRTEEQRNNYSSNQIGRLQYSVDYIAGTNSPVADVYLVYTNGQDGDGSGSGADPGGGGDSSSENPLGTPEHHKTLTPNLKDGKWDGTYTLALDVVGDVAEEEKKTKADIIIVYDISGSMQDKTTEYVNGIGYLTRGTVAEDALLSFIPDVLSKNKDKNDDTVRVGMVLFNSTVRSTLPFQHGNLSKNDLTTLFVGAMNQAGGGNTLSTYQSAYRGATNWEAALQAVSSFERRSDAEQFVIFVSDGNPTCRETKGSYYKTFYGNEYGDSKGGYVEGRYQDMYNSSNYFYGSGYSGYNNNSEEPANNVLRSYTQSLDEARSIVSGGARLYSIGIFGSLERMKMLTNYAYTGINSAESTGYYTEAQNSASLKQAFENIAQTIISDFDYEKVEITDVLSDATSTNLMLDGHAKDFNYYKNSKDDTALTVWTEAPKATYENGTITWPIGALEKDQRYTVTFKVWPNQETYDAIVALENGTKSLDGIDDDIRQWLVEETEGEQKTYKVKSNKSASVSYDRVTKSGNTVMERISETAPYEFPVMETLPFILTVKKTWEPEPDESIQSVELELLEDGKKVVTITLSGETWSSEVIVSPALIATQISAEKLNAGHTYTLRETKIIMSDGTEKTPTDLSFAFTSQGLLPSYCDGTDDTAENGVLTCTNTRKVLSINLIKVDAEDTAKTLSGASFELYRYDSVEDMTHTRKWDARSVDENGKLVFENLTVGFYKLVETKVPDGYLKTASDPWFSVSVNDEGELQVSVLDGSDAVMDYSKKTGEPTLTFKNMPGTKLPDTGGVGTHLYSFGGICLIAAALIYSLSSRRKKRREAKG